MIYRAVLSLLLVFLAGLLRALPAQAMQTADDSGGALPNAHVIQQAVSPGITDVSQLDWRTNTSEVRRLAGIVCAEACGQPWAARVAIAQIVAREAASRGVTIVQLSERTWFVSVWRYATAHPDSWHAQQFADPPAWALQLAADVLGGKLADETLGAMHFDGGPHAGDTFVVGQIHFRP